MLVNRRETRKNKFRNHRRFSRFIEICALTLTSFALLLTIGTLILYMNNQTWNGRVLNSALSVAPQWTGGTIGAQAANKLDGQAARSATASTEETDVSSSNDSDISVTYEPGESETIPKNLDEKSIVTSEPMKPLGPEELKKSGILEEQAELDEQATQAESEIKGNPEKPVEQEEAYNEQTQMPAFNSDTNITPIQSVTRSSVPKVAYLTFDDGPSDYTEDILAILKDYQIHATFFVIGKQIKDNEQILRQLQEEGNYIGLHSMSHNKKKLYQSGGPEQFMKEFIQAQQLLEDAIGTKAQLIRAPYGSSPYVDKSYRDEIAKAEFKMWDWTIDSQDWKYPNKPQKVVSQIKRQAHRDVEVILMHEKKQTVEALPEIIEYLIAKGYAFAVYKPDQHISVNFAKDPRL